MSFLDPYKLLGIDPEYPSLKKLKKSYYNWALLCHPDKGGNEESMKLIHKSYLYIKKQFENCKDVKKYEELEKEFEDFCKKQEEQPPPFREIWENSDEYKKLQNFNKAFEKFKSLNIDKNNRCFDLGYGELMDSSEYIDMSSKKTIDYEKKTKEIKKVTNKFKNELIIYKEPKSNPVGYGNQYRFDVTEINDFSGIANNLSLSDYKKAFNILGEDNIKKFPIKKKTLQSLIEERDEFLENLYDDLGDTRTPEQRRLFLKTIMNTIKKNPQPPCTAFGFLGKNTSHWPLREK